MPGADEVAVQRHGARDLLLVPLADVRIRLGDRLRQHRCRLLEGHVALALLVERHARAVAHELVRQGPRDAADAEREDDVLDGRAVPGFDDVRDQPLHLRDLDLARRGLAEDVLRRELRVARPAGRVDERDVVLLDDLARREEQRGLQAQLRAPGILGDAFRRFRRASAGPWPESSRRRPWLPRPRRGLNRPVRLPFVQEVAQVVQVAGPVRLVIVADRVVGARLRPAAVNQGDARTAARDGSVRQRTMRRPIPARRPCHAHSCANAWPGSSSTTDLRRRCRRRSRCGMAPDRADRRGVGEPARRRAQDP